MKRITVEQINKIEAINGTFSERYEYIDAIAEILVTDCGTTRWNKNHMKTITVDDQHTLDITTKKVKGQRFVVRMDIYNNKGKLQMVLERKRNIWICGYDKEWYDDSGNYKNGAEQKKDKTYNG
jgi:hypothetical protein